MDRWLTDRLKESLFIPCLKISSRIGRRLNNRLRMPNGDEIDERALTEDFVDAFNSSSSENVFGDILQLLRDENIYLDIYTKKSTLENSTGADIGLVIKRSVNIRGNNSSANYAVLIQCKKINQDGEIIDFFHEVPSTHQKQSTLMLDITPNSFYFIFTPPALLESYLSVEPIAFISPIQGCSSPIWNSGSFEFDSRPFPIPILSSHQKEESMGILVIPALAVEANRNTGKNADLQTVLPNCLPFWYWFGELFLPGFIGDRRNEVIHIALNSENHKGEFIVKNSISFNLQVGKEGQ